MTTSYRQSTFINPEQDPNLDLTSFAAKENPVDPANQFLKSFANGLKSLGVKYFANDSIAEYISDREREELKLEIEDKLQGLFDALVIDTDNDHNTHETAYRMAKMYVDEVFKGSLSSHAQGDRFPQCQRT
jgi:GTP cyclohydrolase I